MPCWVEAWQYNCQQGKHPDDEQPVMMTHSKAGYSVRHRRTLAPVPKVRTKMGSYVGGIVVNLLWIFIYRNLVQLHYTVFSLEILVSIRNNALKMCDDRAKTQRRSRLSVQWSFWRVKTSESLVDQREKLTKMQKSLNGINCLVVT
jgi:hypothetical protein